MCWFKKEDDVQKLERRVGDKILTKLGLSSYAEFIYYDYCKGLILDGDKELTVGIHEKLDEIKKRIERFNDIIRLINQGDI